jgi:ketose-bisphosphate aldolase
VNEAKVLRQLLLDKRSKCEGIPAFNYSDMWDLKAIAEVSRKTGEPILVASNPLVVGMLGLGLCQAMVEALKDQTGAHIFNHLDHSNTVDLCIEAIDAGYPSVMIDGSAFDLKTNIGMVKEVVSYASRKNVVVEAEIGRIKGRGVEGGSEGTDFLARVEDAIELADKTGVDTLAVGIGTQHGFYVSKPELNFVRLEEIAKAILKPLVLHGGTGIPDADIRKAISLGITKVNVGTIIHSTYMNSLSDALRIAGKNPYTLDIMKVVLPKVESVLEDRVHAIVGA